HLNAPQLTQFVTFRLADSVPGELIKRWHNPIETDKQRNNKSNQARALRIKIEQYADAGYGMCYLRQPDIANIVQETLLHFHNVRYRLLAWCIMTNHVHVVLELKLQGYPLTTIVQTWKSYTAKKINTTLGRTGQLWMPDY